MKTHWAWSAACWHCKQPHAGHRQRWITPGFVRLHSIAIWCQAVPAQSPPFPSLLCFSQGQSVLQELRQLLKQRVPKFLQQHVITAACSTYLGLFSDELRYVGCLVPEGLIGSRMSTSKWPQWITPTSKKGSRWGHMLGPVSEGGAVALLSDCVGQSVKSALSLYVSCLTPLHKRE